MQPTKIYVAVDVNDRLPEIGQQVFIVSDKKDAIPMRLIRYLSEMDGKELKRVATYWLEEKSMIVLSVEEHKELKDHYFSPDDIRKVQELAYQAGVNGADI